MTISIVDCNSTSRIRQSYDVSFFENSIYTTVTDNHATVTDWIDDIKCLYYLPDIIVGLDIEWRHSTDGHQRNPIALLQLCVGNLCLIYQIIQSEHIPRSLVDFLSRDSIYFPFVGVGIKADLEKLKFDYGIGIGTVCVDLPKLAADVYDQEELKNAGLKDLGRIVMGKNVEMPLAVELGPWDNRQLTEEQVQYATVSAFMSYEIGRILGASDVF